MGNGICSVSGCGRPARARGLCEGDLKRWYRDEAPRYATEGERKAAISANAREQMLRYFERQRAEAGIAGPGYSGRHRRVRKARGRAADQTCVNCGRPAQHWAQIHGTDGCDPADYQPMCAPCHSVYDGCPVRIPAAKTPEQRSAAAKRAWSQRSPERRAEIVRKIQETKLANQRARRDAELADHVPGDP